MSRYLLSPATQADLEHIWDYTADRWDADQAEEYLRDPILRSRLLAVTTAVAAHVSQGASFERLMGSSIDALKLVSSLTLFGHVARKLQASERLAAYEELAGVAADVLAAAALQGYGPCQFTLDRLGH